MDKFSSISTALLCCLLLSFAVGDDLVLRDPASVRDKLLVLDNGRVVTGKMFPRGNGYDVLQPGGRLFIGSEQIRFQADDMDDAWQKMRDSMGQLTPDTHLELAVWCRNNKLYGRAKKELLDALHLDPYRGDAKRMLESMVRDERYQSNSVKVDMAAKLKQHRELGSMAPQRRSLGGLPGQLAQEFSRRVQPLVSNKCGNSRCHGPGRNEFVVLSISRGMTPVKSEQNLAAILNQINYEAPLQSPLLQAAEGLHGGGTRPLFPGQTGRSQLQTLRAWVVNAAEELAPSRPGGLIQQPEMANPIKTVAGTNVTNQLAQANQTGPQKLSLRENEAQQFEQKALVATKHDAFDPDVFNRKYHGRSRHDVLPVSQVDSGGDKSQLYQNQAFQTDTSRKESR